MPSFLKKWHFLHKDNVIIPNKIHSNVFISSSAPFILSNSPFATNIIYNCKPGSNKSSHIQELDVIPQFSLQTKKKALFRYNI